MKKEEHKNEKRKKKETKEIITPPTEKKPVAVITGGTSGIGASYSTYFAAKGYELIVIDRELDAAKNFFIDNLEKKYKVKVRVVKADLSKKINIKQLETFLKKYNNIEYLINCAGFGLGKTFLEGNEEKEEAMVFVHDITPLRLTRAVLPQMIENKKGYIINISSLGGLIPMYGDVIYGSTKAFLKTFTETLHLEIKGTGVQTCVVAPGFVKTHFHDTLSTKGKGKHFFTPWLEPEDVVFATMKGLRKKNVIIIPHWKYRFLYNIYKIIPRKLFYRLAIRLSKEKKEKKGEKK